MKIISYEPMGMWPIYKTTLKEILEELGAEIITKETGTEETTSYIGFPLDSPLLNKYCRSLEDDGMGYGIEERWITNVDNLDGQDIINVWREKELPKEELDEYIKKIHSND